MCVLLQKGKIMNNKLFEKQKKKILDSLKREAKLKEVIGGNNGYIKGFWQGYVWALKERDIFTNKQYSELDHLIYIFKHRLPREKEQRVSSD